MASGFSRQRIALLALAFDTSGREVIEDLARRPEVPRSHLYAHLAEAGDGAETPVRWMQLGAELAWTPARWSPSADLGSGLEEAVQEALDVDHWRAGRREIDFLDIVVLRPAEGVGDAGIPAGLLQALRNTRRRFRRIARILLFSAGRFETFGEAAPPGFLRPLPPAGDAEGDVVDVVLLHDLINIEGMVVNDAGESRRQAAGMVAHLTLGELAPVLYRRIQSEHARLGPSGRYVTLGLADWRLTPEGSIAANADHLARRMRALLLADADAPQGGPAGRDAWAAEIEEEVLREPRRPVQRLEEDPSAQLAIWQAAGEDGLQSQLRGGGWRLGSLRPLLAARLGALSRLERLSSLKLSSFMDRDFARWYMRFRLEGQQFSASSVHLSVAWKGWKVALLTAAGLACPTAIGVAALTPHVLAASVAAGVAGLGAIVLAATGLKHTEAVEIPGQPLPSLLPELRYLRHRNWLAQQLAGRWRTALEAWDGIRRRLREAQEADEATAAAAESAFPFSAAVCAGLQEQLSIHPAECVQRFWENEPQAFSAALGMADASLADLLLDHARRCCEPLKQVGWSEILRALGGEPALADPIWRESLEKARAAALPWLPVEGASGQTFLALPKSLSADLRAALQRHFPGQKVLEEIDGDSILVLQLAQGYEVPAEPRAHAKL